MTIQDFGEIIPLVSDVGHHTFEGSCSVIFSALQFALDTGIQKIMVVGYDVTEDVYAGDGGDGDHAALHNRLLNAWKLVPNFVNNYYPGTGIPVVRPVGLRNDGFTEVFHDDSGRRVARKAQYHVNTRRGPEEYNGHEL